MIHYQNAITNTKGDALIGYFVKLASTADDSAITLYADSSLTPIVSVSGVADACLVDSDGMADLWVASGTYHMDIYATDGTTLVRRETFVQFGVPDGDYGDVSVASDVWTVEAVNGVAPTTVGAAVFGAASQAAARTAIGAGVGGGDLISTNNLSDVASASTSRTNLGLGTAATQASTVFCQTANNLSDVANATTARTNLAAAAHDPAIQSVSSAATVTPTFSNDQVNITAQAVGLTLANPTGTAIPAWGLVIRIKDNGTAQTIAYGTQYRAIGVTLPTTTVISKTLYLALIYNSTDTKWDVVAVAPES